MTTPTEGTCQRCGTTQPLVDYHGSRGTYIAWHRPDGTRPPNGEPPGSVIWPACHGAYLRSREHSAGERAKRETRAQRKEAAVVEQAAIVLDMLLEQRHTDLVRLGAEKVDELIKIAVRRYRMRFDVRHMKPWTLIDRDGLGWRGARVWGSIPRGIDAYCSFCRELLVGDYREARDHRVVRHHTTICALQLLAGTLEPAAPTERRLPHAVRQEAA